MNALRWLIRWRAPAVPIRWMHYPNKARRYEPSPLAAGTGTPRCSIPLDDNLDTHSLPPYVSPSLVFSRAWENGRLSSNRLVLAPAAMLVRANTLLIGIVVFIVA